MRRFFHFSVRDLLLLTLVVAMGLGWFVRERQLAAEAGEAKRKCEAACEAQAVRANAWRKRTGALEEAFRTHGARVKWELAKDNLWVIYEGSHSTVLSATAYEPSIKDD